VKKSVYQRDIPHPCGISLNYPRRDTEHGAWSIGCRRRQRRSWKDNESLGKRYPMARSTKANASKDFKIGEITNSAGGLM
jgi:hypothetical protein